MSKSIMLASFFGFAALLLVASSAKADYACLVTTSTTGCPAGQHKTITSCCPATGAVPNPANGACGQVSAGGQNLVGGGICQASQGGCIATTTGVPPTGTCTSEAAAACKACGCATTTTSACSL